MKIKPVIVGGAIFTAGFFIGDAACVMRVRKKLSKVFPILAEGMVEVGYKSATEDLTEEVVSELTANVIKEAREVM